MVERFKPELEKPSLHNPCYSAFMRKTEYGMWVHYNKYKQSQRALWLARAERASSEKAHYYIMSTYCEPHSNKQKWMKRISFTWEKVERKCRAKAEEYK